jgi:hypothetical protein
LTAVNEPSRFAPIFRRWVEYFRRLVLHAVGVLSGGVDRQAIVAPVRHDAVGFHRDMRLHLGSIVAFDDDVRFAEALIDIAARTAFARPAQVAFLRQAFGRAAAARRRLLLRRAGKNQRCVVAHRCFELRHMRQAFVLDANQFRRGFRSSRRCRGDRGDRLSCETHQRIRFFRLVSKIAQLRCHQYLFQHVDRTHAGIGCGSRGVDRLDACMRNRAADDTPVQHAR